MRPERRRSERIMFTIPLLVQGTDAEGKPFEAMGRTITLNRHGARIQLSRPLRAGQSIRVSNQNSLKEADFRVVGPLSPPAERVGEWAVEYVDPGQDIWDIYFPPAISGSEAKVLLECRKCHAIALYPMSLVEVEVLETAGILSKPCARCETVTPCGIQEQQFEMEASKLAALIRSQEKDVPKSDRRRFARMVLRQPIRVRDFYGGTEVTETENLSTEGMCFTSAKEYLVGQTVMVVSPFNPDGPNVEARARVVRLQPFAGTMKRVYAVRFDRMPS